MTFRKVIFWIHLVCGVSAGLVILMMSATGVLLTYERQITGWFTNVDIIVQEPGSPRLAVARLLESVLDYAPDASPVALTVSSDPTAPVTVQLDRFRKLYIDPYSGKVLGEGARGIRDFFHTITSWHRWFNTEGKARGTARSITGACNLIFLFLVLSGIYLWFPRRFKWPFIRGVLLFNTRAKSGRARDYNWHHVFGFWSSFPLAIVLATAVVFSYPWANDLVFRMSGDQPVRRGLHGPGAGHHARENGNNPQMEEREPGAGLSLDELLRMAATHLDNWNTITIQQPESARDNANFTIDLGNGGQPQKRHQLTLNRLSGEVIKWEPFTSLPQGQRLRIFIRFLHTGEVFGFFGQTIAGLVSLAAMLMVWTGLALAYRRLIQPLFRKS